MQCIIEILLEKTKIRKTTTGKLVFQCFIFGNIFLQS